MKRYLLGKYQDLATLQRDFIKIDVFKNILLSISAVCIYYLSTLLWAQWQMITQKLQHELLIESLFALIIFVIGFSLSQRQGYWKATLLAFVQDFIILSLVMLCSLFVFQWSMFIWHPFVVLSLIILMMFGIVGYFDVAYSQAYQVLDAHLHPRKF